MNITDMEMDGVAVSASVRQRSIVHQLTQDIDDGLVVPKKEVNSNEPLAIQVEKIVNLAQLDFSDKIVICDQINVTENTSVKLWLERSMHNSKSRISLNGAAFRNGVMLRAEVLGFYKPNINGVQSIKSACECYTFSSMFKLILS